MSKKAPLLLGKGFVGLNLSNYFSEIDLEHLQYNRKMLDYTNIDVLSNFLKNKREEISYIVNCFGYTGVPNVDGCEENKELCWRWNV
jgi:dTDP-4-dehydrorhamnose reductase